MQPAAPQARARLSAFNLGRFGYKLCSGARAAILDRLVHAFARKRSGGDHV